MASRARKGRRPPKRKPVRVPAGFGALSKIEQIRYLQGLWDRISEQPDDIRVPESHLMLAEERLADYRRDPARARPAHDTIDRLTNRHR